MTLGSWSGLLLRGARPLGHLVWWAGSGPAAPPGLRDRLARAGLPQVSPTLPEALEETMRSLPGIPVLERSGVFWLAPEFDAPLEALREAVTPCRGWELHTVSISATPHTLQALTASALHSLEGTLSSLSAELELLLSQPRQRASLLVRRLDALEAVRRQAGLHARYLELTHEGLGARLDAWAARIEAALCARIVA